MNKLLFQFFILNKKLSLPNIGSFAFRKDESNDDFANRTIMPELGKIVFTNENDRSAEDSLKNYAQKNFQVLPQELDGYFQYLAEEFKKTNRLTIDGLGVLTNKNSQIEFEPSFSTAPFFQPIATKRVIHPANVEDSTPQRHRSYWWVYVLIILIITAAGYAFYHFYFVR